MWCGVVSVMAVMVYEIYIYIEREREYSDEIK